jgi:hypothetical protein
MNRPYGAMREMHPPDRLSLYDKSMDLERGA